MLQKIRDKSQGPIITFIIVAICLMFAVTGVDAILGSGSAGKVAKVNGEKVTEQELNEVVFLKKRQLIAQMGENLDPAMLEDAKLKQPALDELIKRKLLLQLAEQNHMLVSDSAISKMIAKNPDFQQEGKFSKELFQSLLANSGLTPSLYKRLYATDVLLQQVTSGIVETGFTTDKDIAINSRITHQTRDIRYATLSLAKEIPAITVSVEESKAYYEAHPEQFRSEETVVADYIELDQNDFVAEINEQKIKEAYDQEVAGFKAEEQREISHILIEVDADTSKEQAMAQLGDIRKKIAAGEDFAELARTYSDDLGSKEAGGILGTLSNDAFPPAFVSAAKALAQGETSEVVETDSGLHLIQLTSVHTPVMPGFDERKEAIKAELQAAGAASRYAEAMEKLRDLAFNSPDLAEPAQALDVTVKTSEKIRRQGKADGLFSHQAVRTALFQENLLNNGENSEVIELSPTRSVVVRVKEHHPAVLLAFDDVASRATELLTAEKARQQLADKADALVKEALATADIETLSANKAFSWQHFLASKRASPDADQEAVDAAFRLPRTVGKQFAVDKVQKTNGDVLIVVASNVQDGSMADVDPMQLMAFKSFMARSDAVEEYEAFQEHLRTQAEIDIY